MNLNETVLPDNLQANRPVFDRARLLYSGAATLLLILTFVGFQQFYLHGKAFPDRVLSPPIRPLLILHGTAMTAWMLIFLTQTLLIARGNRRAHRILGWSGAVLAACIVVLGLQLAVASARVNPPEMMLWGLAPSQFLIVPVITILNFATFVLVGVCNRRQREVHRPMMLLAVLAVMPAALDRIDLLRDSYGDTIWGTVFGPFFSTLVLGLIVLIANRLLTRSWDRWYAVGYAGLVVVSVLIMRFATTNEWAHIARLLLR